MTILTKPSNDKKVDKVPLPLADEVAMLAGTAPPLGNQQSHVYNPDVDEESMEFNRSTPHFFKTLVLFLSVAIVMLLGVVGGYSIYRMHAQRFSNLHYRTLCDIPYQVGNLTLPRVYGYQDGSELSWRQFMPDFSDPMSVEPLNDNSYFREQIELDMTDDEEYSKIDVPDFKNGRRGRFMHDFKENQSAIIDTTANRCFIMPLDRETTLPPKSFLDLVQKMGSGYYNIDTDRIRHRMRVVTPRVTDLTLISERIANECYDMKVYMLEKYVSGVSKREIKEINSFSEFSGKGIVQFELMNIDDIDELERKEQQHQK